MIKYLQKVIGFLLITISVNSYAQVSDKIIYIEIQGLTTERGFPEVQAILMAIEKVHNVEYCQKLGIVIIEASSNSSGIEKSIHTKLKSANYKFIQKKNVSIEALEVPCKLNNVQHD